MRFSVIKNGKHEIVETDAPMQTLVDHISNEYLNRTSLEEYLKELGHTYQPIKASINLNYDEI